MTKKMTIHSAIPELRNYLFHGLISRREFLRYATLLGMSSIAASRMCGLFSPGNTEASSARRGGQINVASILTRIGHPARISYISTSNVLRQVAEYLTYTDRNNITHPYLLNNWSASDDLRTWTLNLRRGIKFNNGDDFTADDVIFTMNQWFKKDVDSSMLGLMGSYLDRSDIEKVDDYQIKLHLKHPEIAVPEHLFHFPAVVLNSHTFEGDFLKRPIGTGPYNMEDYIEGEFCRLRRRSDYWGIGPDGYRLPYLDKVVFFDFGMEVAPRIAAIRTGDIHMLDSSEIDIKEVAKALRRDPRVNVIPISTNKTCVLRMRVDLEPWTDNRVRQALKLCQNREKISKMVGYEDSYLGQDVHVSPMHPEYCNIGTPVYDPDKARDLLAKAGYHSGLTVNLAVGSGWSEFVRYAEILKQDAASAGFKINIQKMPNNAYWERWKEVDLGLTVWKHYPLGTMVPNLAYTADDKGNPTAWNETRWVDREFSSLLKQANSTLDVRARRKIFCKLERIQQERGSIGNAFWMKNWSIASKKVCRSKPHPKGYLMFHSTSLAENYPCSKWPPEKCECDETNECDSNCECDNDCE